MPKQLKTLNLSLVDTFADRLGIISPAVQQAAVSHVLALRSMHGSCRKLNCPNQPYLNIA